MKHQKAFSLLHTTNPIKEHQVNHIFPQLDQDMIVGNGILQDHEIKQLKVHELKVIIKHLHKGKANMYLITGFNKRRISRCFNYIIKRIKAE